MIKFLATDISPEIEYLITRPTGFKFHKDLFKCDVGTAGPVRGECVESLVRHLGGVPGPGPGPVLAEAGLDVRGGELGPRSECSIVTQEGGCGQLTAI